MRSLGIVLLMVVACHRDEGPRAQRTHAPPPAPRARPTAPAAASAPTDAFLVATKLERISLEPLRWKRAGHLWQRGATARAPLDLGDVAAMRSHVFDDDYWYEARCTAGCDVSHGATHTLSRVDRRSGARTVLATEASGGDDFSGLRIAGPYLLWSSFSGYGDYGAVSRVHRDGGRVELLWEDAAIVDFAQHADGILAWSLGAVAWIPDGGPAQVLARGLRDVSGAALDETTVYISERGDPYWRSADSGRILSVPRAGGPPKVLVGPVRWPAGVAVDDRAVYWILEQRQVVFAAPKAGGATRELALPPLVGADPDCAQTIGLAPDPAGLYVLRSGGGDCGDSLSFVPTR